MYYLEDFVKIKRGQIWRSKFEKNRSVRVGREEQGVRDTVLGKGGKGETEVIKEKYQRNKVTCIPLP